MKRKGLLIGGVLLGIMFAVPELSFKIPYLTSCA